MVHLLFKCNLHMSHNSNAHTNTHLSRVSKIVIYKCKNVREKKKSSLTHPLDSCCRFLLPSLHRRGASRREKSALGGKDSNCFTIARLLEMASCLALSGLRHLHRRFRHFQSIPQIGEHAENFALSSLDLENREGKR